MSLCFLLITVLTTVAFNTLSIRPGEELEWEHEINLVLQDLSSTLPGKHDKTFDFIPSEKTYLGGISTICSQSTFDLPHKAFARRIFVLDGKLAGGRSSEIYLDVYECSSKTEAIRLKENIVSLSQFRVEERKKCEKLGWNYNGKCCDVLFARGSYSIISHRNIILVIVDNWGNHPSYKTIVSAFKDKLH